VYFLIRRLIALWRARRQQDAAGSQYATGLRSAAGSHGVATWRGASGSRGARRTARERSGPSAAARGGLALLGHQVRYDLLASFRNPRARFFTFFFPIVLLVILAGVFGSGHTVIDGLRVDLTRFYVPGILAMSVVVGSYGNLVIQIANLRESGVLKRRRAAPVAAALLIAGQALATLAIVLIMAVILLAVGKLLYGVGFSAQALGALACTVVVGTLACACIGYAVSGLIGNPDAAQPVVQGTTLPLWFISGVFIPNSDLGATLRHIGDVFPVEHLTGAFQRAALHGSFSAAISPTDLLVLAIWGLGAAALAAWRFSWMPSAASA
jgi:ABC-2 type transport system permease protein